MKYSKEFIGTEWYNSLSKEWYNSLSEYTLKWITEKGLEVVIENPDQPHIALNMRKCRTILEKYAPEELI